MTRSRSRVDQPAVIVLQSFPGPLPSTNPYLVQLRDSLIMQPGVEVITFSWLRAVFRRYNVFHVHWPEHLLNGSSALKEVGIRVAAWVFLTRVRLMRMPIVRTVHNLGAHESMKPWQRRWARAIDRATSVRIRLTDETPTPETSPTITIPHGHYSEWFARIPRAPLVPGRLGYFGLIKGYKGVERLIEAFRELPGDVELHIGGRPSTKEFGEQLIALADRDPRIDLELRYLDDAELVSLVSSSELVVLPYREMHNSGSALAALSLARPVLVPDNEVNRQLAREVGTDWVMIFEGELEAQDLEKALSRARRRRADAVPQLSARGWAEAGYQHLEAYRLAIAGAGRRYSP